MIDQFGRTIDSIRISVTNKNNFILHYLSDENAEDPNFDKICKSIDSSLELNSNLELTLEEIDKVIEVLSDNGLERVKIIGGEPLLRSDLPAIIRRIRSHKNIYDVALTTNGLLLEERAEELKNSGLTRVNINLHTLKPENYKSNDDLIKIFNGIKRAQEVGLTPVKINVELFNGYNDDEIDAFMALTKEQAIDVRFIEIVPGETHNKQSKFFKSTQELIDKYNDMIPIMKTDQNSAATYYRAVDGIGRVGFISPVSCKFCDRCNCISITADGFLKYCMHSKEEIALRPLMKTDRLLENTLRRTIFNKPDAYHLSTEDEQDMVQY